MVNQPKYNLLHRYIEEEVIPVSRRNGIGQVVFSPLAEGVLTGKYLDSKEAPRDSRAANKKMNYFIHYNLNEQVEGKVRKLKAVADQLGVPMARMALAWILRQDNVASALVGASRPAQVEENVQASGLVLPDDALDAIEDALG